MTSPVSGCAFASALAKSWIAYHVARQFPTKDDMVAIDSIIEGAASIKHVAILVFPDVRSSNGIVRLLRALERGSDRWSIRRIAWRQHERKDVTLISVRWRTTTERYTSAMGFAPLGAMPATRRSPYVALALWGGGEENAFKRKSEADIGFIDIPTRMTKHNYDLAMKRTDTDVRQLLNDPPEDMVHLRRVAFCLPRTKAVNAIARE
jgi:hypothetical protein